MSRRDASAEPIIRIRNLRLHGIVGALPHERHVPQPIIVNAELHCTNVTGGITDELPDTVDYAALCDDFARVVAEHPDQLLESLANRLLRIAVADERVVRARLAVAKPQAIANAETVEVELFGSRKDLLP
jgi:FolB domain-containing protein